ncbi:hypothetical protein ABTY01_20035, partial [Streptomyces sp. NPDC095613]
MTEILGLSWALLTYGLRRATTRHQGTLAPAGADTNAPFRTLCRDFSGGQGLFVSEMITTRAL